MDPRLLTPGSLALVGSAVVADKNLFVLTQAKEKADELGFLLCSLEGCGISALGPLKAELQSQIDFYKFLKTRSQQISADLGYFSVLPLEVIVDILSFLDHRGLSHVFATCKFFSELGFDDRIWQNLYNRQLAQLEELKDLSISRPPGKTWQWLCKCRLNVWKPEDNKEGPGTFLCKAADGPKHDSRFYGDWKDNKKHGYGVNYWNSNSLYFGGWEDDMRQGEGTRIWSNGNKYSGEYHKHKRHGVGEFTFSNGSVFKGRFEENKFIEGTYTWPNGRVYDGEWNNIYRHGFGKYRWPDGRSYVGHWKDDKRHGVGKYCWSDGDYYNGEFVDGKRCGKGELVCANGDVYEQEWDEQKFQEFHKGIEPVDSEEEYVMPKNRKRKGGENGLDSGAFDPAMKHAKLQADDDNMEAAPME
eukprot:TRINITY_DN2669_c0_g1_i1.p1 TRINITY_DN2669_c0_g1~~TRINITY_DN2669_c0_g1_i1.p1  ORF type:complete len:415 (-),score=47.02 TRINITY_DN2669_c0_g1_i1:458-1702(-)